MSNLNSLKAIFNKKVNESKTLRNLSLVSSPGKSLGNSFESYKMFSTKSNKSSYIRIRTVSENYLNLFTDLNMKKKDKKYFLSQEGFKENTTKNFEYSFKRYMNKKLGKV